MYGVETGINLPLSLTLVINLGQVYYDSKISINNNIDSMMNFGLNLNYNF